MAFSPGDSDSGMPNPSHKRYLSRQGVVSSHRNWLWQLYRLGADNCRRGTSRPNVPRGSGQRSGQRLRFLAGDESEEYLQNPQNLGLFDVNTIANYDSEICQHH